MSDYWKGWNGALERAAEEMEKRGNGSSAYDIRMLKVFIQPEIPDDRIYHVYPTFGREHVTNKRDQCWCQPRIQLEGDGAIIIHEVEQ